MRAEEIPVIWDILCNWEVAPEYYELLDPDICALSMTSAVCVTPCSAMPFQTEPLGSDAA